MLKSFLFSLRVKQLNSLSLKVTKNISFKILFKTLKAFKSTLSQARAISLEE